MKMGLSRGSGCACRGAVREGEYIRRMLGSVCVVQFRGLVMAESSVVGD